MELTAYQLATVENNFFSLILSILMCNVLTLQSGYEYLVSEIEYSINIQYDNDNDDEDLFIL